jgi:hypothetical protein
MGKFDKFPAVLKTLRLGEGFLQGTPLGAVPPQFLPLCSFEEFRFANRILFVFFRRLC